EHFTFVLKASQRITHIKRLKECGELLGLLFRVSESLGPRLGPLLFQLPPNFRKDVPRLRTFFEQMPGRRRVAFEFRHASWFDDETFAALKDNDAALCVADTGEEPAAPLVATTDWGYLRLRREDFSDGDLCDWARRIREQPWGDAFVFLKHEEEGRGPKLAHLERQGRSLTRLDAEGDEGSTLERTLAQMRAGADIIVQATLVAGRWLGRADVLLRVERKSNFGAWSYEALDTKLAQET